MSSGLTKTTKTTKTCLAVLFGVVLTATGLWAGAAEEEEPAAAMEKEMVLDPSTGKMVVAPQYGGTITFALLADPASPDSFLSDHAALMIVAPVLEKLAWGDWATPRDQWGLPESPRSY